VPLTRICAKVHLGYICCLNKLQKPLISQDVPGACAYVHSQSLRVVRLAVRPARRGAVSCAALSSAVLFFVFCHAAAFLLVLQTVLMAEETLLPALGNICIQPTKSCTSTSTTAGHPCPHPTATYQSLAAASALLFQGVCPVNSAGTSFIHAGWLGQVLPCLNCPKCVTSLSLFFAFLQGSFFILKYRTALGCFASN